MSLDLAAIVKRILPAPPLPPPAGPVVRAADVDALARAVGSAQPGTTILVAPGIYRVARTIELTANDVTIRGETGDRESVVLDGAAGVQEILRIVGAQRTLVADLTVRNGSYYGIKFYADSDVQGLRVYNVKFHSIPVRGLKGSDPYRPGDSGSLPKLPAEVAERVRARHGEVRHCLFLCDAKKTDRNDGFDGDYISGIDMVRAGPWTVANSVFLGIRGFNGGGRGAVFVWVDSEDVVVERNLFVDCDRSVSFGNPSFRQVNMRRGIIRDNVIVGGAGMAIECCGVTDTDVCGNWILATQARTPTVHFFQGSRNCRFQNNCVSGRVVCDDPVQCENNREDAPADALPEWTARAGYLAAIF